MTHGVEPVVRCGMVRDGGDSVRGGYGEQRTAGRCSKRILWWSGQRDAMLTTVSLGMVSFRMGRKRGRRRRGRQDC